MEETVTGDTPPCPQAAELTATVFVTLSTADFQASSPTPVTTVPPSFFAVSDTPLTRLNHWSAEADIAPVMPSMGMLAVKVPIGIVPEAET